MLVNMLGEVNSAEATSAQLPYQAVFANHLVALRLVWIGHNNTPCMR
jgi:hypothetical protein